MQDVTVQNGTQAPLSKTNPGLHDDAPTRLLVQADPYEKTTDNVELDVDDVVEHPSVGGAGMSVEPHPKIQGPKLQLKEGEAYTVVTTSNLVRSFTVIVTVALGSTQSAAPQH